MERLKCGSYIWGASDAAVWRKPLDWIKGRETINTCHENVYENAVFTDLKFYFLYLEQSLHHVAIIIITMKKAGKPWKFNLLNHVGSRSVKQVDCSCSSCYWKNKIPYISWRFVSYQAIIAKLLYCLALCWSNRGLLNIGFILRKYNLRDIFW